tara:strand:+ start:45 stop:173 length:129 start_codon:yes stop_codon:yes gene_type:complete
MSSREVFSMTLALVAGGLVIVGAFFVEGFLAQVNNALAGIYE